MGGRVVLTDGSLQEAGNVIFNNGSAAGIGRGEDPFGHAALASRTTDYVSGVYLVTPASVWRMLDGFDETCNYVLAVFLHCVAHCWLPFPLWEL